LLHAGYVENVDIIKCNSIGNGKLSDYHSGLLRDVALLRGTFGIDWQDETLDMTPERLFEHINEMWIYLFSIGKYSISFDSGEPELKVNAF
jgi:hypothetical protein